MQIAAETVERVRERASILDQFNGTELKKAGREYIARCPWHDDHKPSLTVSPKTNRAYCFVCARGVDSIGWIQDRHGLSFAEAIIELADKYGIEVKTQNDEDSKRLAEERQEKQRLFKERADLQERLHSEIWLSPGLSYLHQRGLSNETITHWGLGWNGTRVTFPLCDELSRVVAHTGRVIDNEQHPKYKNSSNSLIYQKSEMVFGLDKAMPEICKSGSVVICEGQMDVIRCWQEGIRNMVAVSGSALTPGMVQRITSKTRAKKITLAFDGDNAGLKAADRARQVLMQTALTGDLTLRILTLPDGKDPADLAAEGDKLLGLINSAPNWAEWWLHHELAKHDLQTADGIVAAERIAREILRHLPVGALREYVRDQCRELLRSVPEVAPARIRTQKQINQCRWAERRAVRLYLLDTGSRPAIDSLNFSDETVVKAFDLIKALEGMCPTRPEIVRPAFERIVTVASVEEQAELMPLVYPIPEVRRVIDRNPLGELEAAMKVLQSKECGP